jgi:hypothetical protein
MADITHAVLTDPEIHEPKGITTASAGQVYRADGVGSGSWEADEAVNRVYVTQASDLAGTLDSTVEYFIDGIVDMGSQTITVPVGGLSLSGYNFDISKLVSSAAGYTMFVSAGGGSGNLLGKDYGIEVTGTGSQVYNLTSATGFDAFEFARINYNDCTSLGTITGYRQGLESGTGRFGGSPTLTLAGTWLGGYFIETSIVRSLDAGMTTPLFAAGAAFVMNSRFRSNQNIDLPPSAAFLDFASSNFPNASTLQLQGCIVTRGGLSDATDSNITPNVGANELASSWSFNQGMPNTYVGGTNSISVASATTVSATSTFYDLAGTWAPSDLQHFDEPAGGQLRHLGDNPREFRLVGSIVIEGPANDDVAVKVVKWDESAAGFVDVYTQTREINNLVGGTNRGFYSIAINLTLDKDDYVKLQVSNDSTTGNLTGLTDSFFTVLER